MTTTSRTCKAAAHAAAVNVIRWLINSSRRRRATLKVQGRREEMRRERWWWLWRQPRNRDQVVRIGMRSRQPPKRPLMKSLSFMRRPKMKGNPFQRATSRRGQISATIFRVRWWVLNSVRLQTSILWIPSTTIHKMLLCLCKCSKIIGFLKHPNF